MAAGFALLGRMLLSIGARTGPSILRFSRSKGANMSMSSKYDDDDDDNDDGYDEDDDCNNCYGGAKPSKITSKTPSKKPSKTTSKKPSKTPSKKPSNKYKKKSNKSTYI